MYSEDLPLIEVEDLSEWLEVIMLDSITADVIDLEELEG